MTYAELAARVENVRIALAGPRRLALVAGANTVEGVVGYLGALAAGHAVALVADQPHASAAIVGVYDPDIIVRPGGVQVRRTISAHELHPDLALLLSTSGSTGSAKLVRLSYRNLTANAEAIATYLDIRATDRAATTLPMHYCYGLSVVHSHLLRGAGLILTERSVIEPEFWAMFTQHGGTSFAGVPHTFDLLDRVGFDTMSLPALRYVTQAGGRLAPEKVRDLAALGRRRGWDLFVMYGQTEATARMAYLPPHLAESHPAAVGIPIPGGEFRLEPTDGEPTDGGSADGGSADGLGELVYFGPNVMLGYAESPADLALGRCVDVLRTGDLGRRTAAGLYEIVGRRSRFLKIFGLRIDPASVEAALADEGLAAVCGGDDSGLLVVFESGRAGAERVREIAAHRTGLPKVTIRAHEVEVLPRLASGKPDQVAALALGARTADTTPATYSQAGPPLPRSPRADPTRAGAASAGRPELADLRALFAEVLGRDDVRDDSSFVELGGDSLSYVEMAIRLEQTLGHLPADWHRTPVRDLGRPGRAGRQGPTRRTRRRTLETTIMIRALSIVLVVGTHAELFAVRGGAHLLLAVAGFNFGRFQLTSATRGDRVRGVLRSTAWIAGATSVWVVLAMLLFDRYTVANALLLNDVFGPEKPGAPSNFWFIEALVYGLLAVLAVLATPLGDRLERRSPFGFAVAFLCVGLALRYVTVEVVGLNPTSTHLRLTPIVVFWLVVLGWCIARADSTLRRVLLSIVTPLAMVGFFDNLARELVVIAGVLLLIWVPALPSTQTINRVAGAIAAGSLYIYLTHWVVSPWLEDFSRFVALVVAVAVGIGYGHVFAGAVRKLSALGTRMRTRHRVSESAD